MGWLRSIIFFSIRGSKPTQKKTMNPNFLIGCQMEIVRQEFCRYYAIKSIEKSLLRK